MRERLLFCLLVIGMMLYYAIPKLNFFGTLEERLFAISWLLLAFLAVGGNMAAVLFTPNRKRARKMRKRQLEKKRVHDYE
ncbi:hypothetical protein [Bacillus massiliigorillae]|uniref:hypothetical protein n=1 Tax=Bacillus massiliigorillae TaxID=1243664 RepID=UPI0003A84142|nr:hypothetical protein [Bacillus massiliigorillae]